MGQDVGLEAAAVAARVGRVSPVVEVGTKKGKVAMTGDSRPILSVIVRRFGPDAKDGILQSLDRLQKAAAGQTGYLGDHNSLSNKGESYELVNVFAFDSRENLEKWENSDLRRTYLAELDTHPQEPPHPTQFDEFAKLWQPVSKINKIEVVVILIFWIVALGELLGHLAGFLLPAEFPDTARSVLLISVNVVLISYVFLPWSTRWLARLKTRFNR